MDTFERRRLRLLDILKDVSAKELGERSDVDATLISRYKLPAEHKNAKRIGEGNARKLERGAHKPDGWLDQRYVLQEPPAPWPNRTSPRQDEQWQQIRALSWESLVSEKPEYTFELALRDNALGATYPAGTRTVWEPKRSVKAGRLVLLQDQHGNHLARIAQEAPGTDRWRFIALTPGFAEYEHDQVTVLAVCGGILFPQD